MLHSWKVPVKIRNEVRLSDSSGRIDILSSILGLEGDNENLLLDLHYSYLRPRIWPRDSCLVRSLEVLNKAREVKNQILEELLKRVPDQDAEVVLRDWISDLELLSSISGSGGDLEFVRTVANEFPR